MDKPTIFRYNGLELPENLNYILEQEFWFLDNITGATLALLKEPMKFTSTTSIFVRKGICKAEINLRQYTIEAPCFVNITSSQIMQPIEISADFEGAFVVMSKRFIDNFVQLANQNDIISKYTKYPVLQIPPQHLSEVEMFYKHLHQIVNDKTNPFLYQTVLYTLLSFFFEIAIKCLVSDSNSNISANHITNQFIKLAQENFRKERFLDFYANKLQITSKHLSRTVKVQTGYTACEWLDRLVILEAKVLLKGSNMNIQQIAEALNFPTQSLFGKYFKHIVGISPKDFRNS